MGMNALLLHIGSQSDYVAVRVGPGQAGAGWVIGECEIRVRGFSGAISAYFEPQDFREFEAGVHALYATLNGQAQLHPVEQQLLLTLDGNGRGGVNVSGEAWSQAGDGNKLTFAFELDQTFLPAILGQLRTLNAELEPGT
jgi:hypothetical protein